MTTLCMTGRCTYKYFFFFMLTRLQTLLLSLPPKCHLIKLLPVKVALCKPRSESPFQAASPRSHYNREACQHTGWHCPGTNVMALCSHTQKHWPCSTIYNNATYKRLLSLVYEVYTVLRSVLAPDGLAKIKVGFPSNSLGSKHSYSFIIFLHGGGWRGHLWAKQRGAWRLERKGPVVELVYAVWHVS